MTNPDNDRIPQHEPDAPDVQAGGFPPCGDCGADLWHVDHYADCPRSSARPPHAMICAECGGDTWTDGHATDCRFYRRPPSADNPYGVGPNPSLISRLFPERAAATAKERTHADWLDRLGRLRDEARRLRADIEGVRKRGAWTPMPERPDLADATRALDEAIRQMWRARDALRLAVLNGGLTVIHIPADTADAEPPALCGATREETTGAWFASDVGNATLCAECVRVGFEAERDALDAGAPVAHAGTCLHCGGAIEARTAEGWAVDVRAPCPHCGRAGW